MDIKVVIGANYGDEGKGLVTNLLTRQAKDKGDKVLVVIGNGGPQRGHTVLNNGIRHIFHHFGSGSLSGADTYMDKTFMINPIVFAEEYKELKSKIAQVSFPAIYAHIDCLVTTPYDMIINQVTSSYFGFHNSCGLGIWETYKRRKITDQTKTLGWFIRKIWTGKEKDIYTYLMTRYNSLKDDVITSSGRIFLETPEIDLTSFNPDKTIDIYLSEFLDGIDNWGLIKHWVEDMKTFISSIHLVNDDSDIYYDEVHSNIRESIFLKQYNTIIIEQGQGLLLDRDYDKVYGTPGKTNASSAMSLIARYNKCHIWNSLDIDFCYVTRSYLTRHGDGPMSGNPIQIPDEDKTNIPNPWQGSIKCAELNFREVFQRIDADITYPDSFEKNLSGVLMSGGKHLFITHSGVLSEFNKNYIAELKEDFNYWHIKTSFISKEDCNDILKEDIK